MINGDRVSDIRALLWEQCGVQIQVLATRVAALKAMLMHAGG
jgi:hypothetical protein